jgi:hypothetical protein
MFDVFEDLGRFEAHVLDSSSQDISATVAAEAEGRWRDAALGRLARSERYTVTEWIYWWWVAAASSD